MRSRYEHLPTFDRAKVDELIQLGKDIQEDVLGQMVNLHFQTSQNIIEEIKFAFGTTNLPRIAELAHKFKSNSGQLGLVKLHVLCDDLEGLINSGNYSSEEINTLLYFIYAEDQLTHGKLAVFQGFAT